MIEQRIKIQKKSTERGLWNDHKFRLLVIVVAVVACFEIFALLGWRLPPVIAAPFFASIIFAVGWKVVLNGFRALIRLNFKSINLLMLIAVIGAFYLGHYEEGAVVIVLFALGERLEQYGIQTSKSSLQSLVDGSPKTAT